MTVGCMQGGLDAVVNEGVSFATVRSLSTKVLASWRTDGESENYLFSTYDAMGVHVLKNGSWGFHACGVGETGDGSKQALEFADAARKINQRYNGVVKLAPAELKMLNGHWDPLVLTNPFKMQQKEIQEYLATVEDKLRAPYVKHTRVGATFSHMKKDLLISPNLETDQTTMLATVSMHVIGERDGRLYSLSCESDMLVAQGGWERVLEWNLYERAEKLKAELEEALKAPLCPTKVFPHAILDPTCVVMQVHETAGHGLELDRIIGDEIGFYGGSFVKIADIGNLQYGSQRMNLRVDPTYAGAAGSYKWDDEGTPAQDIALIKDGILVNVLSSRESAAHLPRGPKGPQKSTGAMRAEDDCFHPIIRMSNIFLQPGNDGTVDDLIAATDYGILLSKPRCWSIDPLRRSYQFSAEVGWLVKGGQKRHMVAFPAYSGNTLATWRSLDMVGSKATLLGVTNCGKGQPGQQVACGHPSPPIRVQSMNVFPDSTNTSIHPASLRRNYRQKRKPRCCG